MAVPKLRKSEFLSIFSWFIGRKPSPEPGIFYFEAILYVTLKWTSEVLTGRVLK